MSQLLTKHQGNKVAHFFVRPIASFVVEKI